MTKDILWDALDRIPLTAQLVFKDSEGDEKHHYLPFFDDQHEGEDAMVIPSSILWMKIKRDKMP